MMIIMYMQITCVTKMYLHDYFYFFIFINGFISNKNSHINVSVGCRCWCQLTIYVYFHFVFIYERNWYWKFNFKLMLIARLIFDIYLNDVSMEWIHYLLRNAVAATKYMRILNLMQMFADFVNRLWISFYTLLVCSIMFISFANFNN